MTNKHKEVIVKISIIISGIMLLFSAFVFPICCSILKLDFDDLENHWIILLLLTLLCSIIMILLIKFWGITNRKNQAERIPIFFKNYESFMQTFKSNVFLNGYNEICINSETSDKKFVLFYKISNVNILDCFAVFKYQELNENDVIESNKRITELFNFEPFENIPISAVNMISIFCVDRITNTFSKLVNAGSTQNFKTGRFIVGVSFGSDKMYVSKPNSDFGIWHYKKLKKEFFSMLQ